MSNTRIPHLGMKNIRILELCINPLDDFSCMVEIEVDNIYNYTLRRNIMKTQKVDRSV